MDDGRLVGVIADKVRVPLPTGTPAPDLAPPTLGAAPVNLVSLFQASERSKIASRVVDDFEEDVGSREEHMRRLRRWYELYASVMKVKSWPFQGAANVNIPILTYAILQVHGRLFDMLLPAKGDVYHAVPTRVSDQQAVDRAERTELFANWYLRENVPEYRMSYDATLWQLLIFGSTFRYFYWDYTENRLCTEWVGIDDFVVPYHCKVTDPSMRGVPRYTLVRHPTLFELQDRAERGELDTEAVNSLGAPARDAKSSTEMQEVIDDVDGKSRGSRQDFLEDEDRNVLEQHRWLRMPNAPERHEAFDGKPHPVIVTVDETDRKVLRIVLRQEADPRDAKRFAKEKEAFDAAEQARAEYAATGGVTVDPQTQELMLAPEPPAVPEPRPARWREVCFFTHYLCFQGEGFYGLGLGHFLGGANEAMNTIFNQQIDRATVNNAGGGLISRQMRFQRGPIDRQPGKYVEVDVPPSALKDGLQNWPQVAPDPEGRWFIQYIEQMANRVSGAGDTLSGEPVGANETARAAMARYEQAQKQISVLASRVIGYLTCDARIIWRLFATFLDEEEYHEVVDSAGQPRRITIGRADFHSDAKVVPTADARVTSHAQRMSEAQEFMVTVTNPEGPPELTQNPMIRRAAIEGYLYAADRHDAIQLLGPPPGPPQPPQPKKQYEENADFLRDQDAPVLPDDDDDMHLLEIQHFKTDPLGGEKLSPTGKKMLDAHERGHLAQKLTKEKQNHAREQAALSGPPGGGGPGLEGAPGVPALGPLPPS